MAIIAISRGTLHGGQALAEIVARQLGYPSVSREAIVHSAEWYGIHVDIPTETGEAPSSYWKRLAGERTAYQESFQAAICERASRGNLVYHGHAVHLLMQDVPILRVRVVANMEQRIVWAMSDQGLSREDAAAYVDRVDRERTEWVRYLYGVEWDDPQLYDVVLNLSHLSLDAACSTVVHLARLDEFKLQPPALKEMANCALRTRVSAALSRDIRTGDARLVVAAEDGVITVSGTAPVRALEAVPTVVAAVDGVRNVKNFVQAAS